VRPPPGDATLVAYGGLEGIETVCAAPSAVTRTRSSERISRGLPPILSDTSAGFRSATGWPSSPMARKSTFRTLPAGACARAACSVTGAATARVMRKEPKTARRRKRLVCMRIRYPCGAEVPTGARAP
jgi:hypothetical protein